MLSSPLGNQICDRSGAGMKWKVVLASDECKSFYVTQHYRRLGPTLLKSVGVIVTDVLAYVDDTHNPGFVHAASCIVPVDRSQRLKTKAKAIAKQNMYVINFGHYRATLCISAVISVGRCLSVRLSRWCIVSTRLKISSNILFGQVAPSGRLKMQDRKMTDRKMTDKSAIENSTGVARIAICYSN